MREHCARIFDHLPFINKSYSATFHFSVVEIANKQVNGKVHQSHFITEWDTHNEFNQI